MLKYSPTQLQDILQSAEKHPVLIDVRELWEYETCHLEGSVHIPMGEIVARIDEIPQDQDTVIICHHGIRSAQVVRYLMSQGYENVINLTGGVDGWARDVDPDMPVY